MTEKPTIKVFAESAPEVLNDIANRVKDIAVGEYGIDEAIANQLGVDVALDISNAWRGVPVYIPSDLPLKIKQRDTELFAKFTGNNHRELAREYGVSVVWVYRLVKQIKQKIAEKQQPQLPFE